MKYFKETLYYCIVLFFCLNNSLAAEDIFESSLFRTTSINPTLTGTFTDIMSSMHSQMAEINMPNYFYADLKADLTSIHSNGASGLIGSMLSLSDNLAIPIYLNALNNKSSGSLSNDWTRVQTGIMIGGGLIFYGRYGLLAGYVGHSWNGGTNSWYGYTSSGYESFENEWSENKWQWAIFPFINAKEYPLLNSFIRIIDGFFSLDLLKMNPDEFKPTYKANIVFKEISMSESFKMVLNTYTQRDWFNFDAKYSLYAGMIDFVYDKWSVKPIFSIEGGYRDFFDIQQSEQEFENGIYSKIAIKLVVPDSLDVNSKWGIMLSLESGSTSFFKNPVFGILVSFSPYMEGILYWPVSMQFKSNYISLKSDMFISRF